MASRFIQQFKEPDSASRSPVVITGAYIPEKLRKNKKKLNQKKQIVIILRKNYIFHEYIIYLLELKIIIIHIHAN